MIRILIVDDRNLIRLGIKSLLDQDPNFKIVGMVEDGRSAVRQVELLRPDIVLLDVEMPTMNGITATKYINHYPDTKVIIISGHEEQKYVVKALMAGAKAYILKDSLTDDLKQTILAVNRGYSQIESKLLTKIFDTNTKTRSDTSAIFSKANVSQHQTQVFASSLEQFPLSPESRTNSAAFKNPTSKQNVVSSDTIEANRSQFDRDSVARSQQYKKSYDGNRILLAPSPQSLNSKRANTFRLNKNLAAKVVKAQESLRQTLDRLKAKPYGARICQFILLVDETWLTKNWVSNLGYILLGAIIAVILSSL